MLLENVFWIKFHDFTTEAAKTFVQYFDVLQVDFVKIPCDADLVF